MSNHLQQLLDSSISQHGYWLVNHKSSILGELMERLNKVGIQQAILDLNDYRSDWVKSLYKKIEGSK